jgi:hypothetical protein
MVALAVALERMLEATVVLEVVQGQIQSHLGPMMPVVAAADHERVL